MILNSPYITGSLTVTGNTTLQGTLTVTGSLSGTASLALNSNLLQGTGSVGFSTTASLLAVSSSQQQISASLLNVVANYATTGSNSFRANQSITGSLVVSSTITAQTLVVQTVTSSIVYSSGSNNFGNQLANTQTFTGSVNITGSLTVNTTGTEFQVNATGVKMGNVLTDSHTVTGSLLVTGSIGINTSSLASNVFLHAYSTTNTQINVETAGSGQSYSQYTLKSGTGDGAAFFLNNASRTAEAGGNMATVRNDVGSLRLQSAGGAASASLGITVLSGSGYVGMGTNSPAYQLDVTGIAHVYGESLRLKNVNGSNTGVQFWNQGGTRHWSIFEQFGASGQQGSLNFENNVVGNVPMLITSGGIIGIGTPSPDSNVLVHTSYSGAGKQGLFVQNTGADEATIRFKSAHSLDSDFRIGASIAVSNSFEIYSVNAAASRLCINPSGSLGVKTTSFPNFSSTANILKVGSQAMFGYFGSSGGGETWILNNAYYDGSWKGINSSTSAQIIKLNDNNEIRIYNNAGVTANTTFTPTQILTVTTGSVVANQLLRVRAGQSADTISDDSPLAVSKSGTSNWVAVFDRNSTSSATGALFRNGRNTASNDSPFITTEANHPDCGGTSTTVRHRLWANGNGTCSGAWTGGGADYAEFFEWVDGNPNNENRVGYPVSLVNNKIKIAEVGEIIIGIISASPSVIGDDGLYWKKKFLTNDLGEYILDENGGQIVNPEFDPNIPYVPRSERKEWAVVGLMGKIRMKKGQLTMSSWIKMRDISDTVEEWLVK